LKNRNFVKSAKYETKNCGNDIDFVAKPCYDNIARLAKINFCIAFAICSLLNANNKPFVEIWREKVLASKLFHLYYNVNKNKR